jgi:uncharacterized protein (TIGR03067 family)
MRFRLLLVLAAIVPSGFAPAPFPKTTRNSDPNRKDLEALQGEWVAASFRVALQGGGVADAPDMRAVFRGRDLTFSQDGREITLGEVRLDISHQPRHIDFVEVNRGRTARGIYRIQDESITVCWKYTGERPADFDEGEGRVVFVLKRQ